MNGWFPWWATAIPRRSSLSSTSETVARSLPSTSTVPADRLNQANHVVDRHGLPGARGPQENGDGPARHREVDAVQAALRAKALHDARELDRVPGFALT